MVIKKFPDKFNIAEFIPVRLDEAIKYRAMDHKEAAEKLGIDYKALRMILLRGEGITIELVFKFSDVLEFPVAFFFKPLPPRSIYVESPLFIN